MKLCGFGIFFERSILYLRGLYNCSSGLYIFFSHPVVLRMYILTSTGFTSCWCTHRQPFNPVSWGGLLGYTGGTQIFDALIENIKNRLFLIWNSVDIGEPPVKMIEKYLVPCIGSEILDSYHAVSLQAADQTTNMQHCCCLGR